MDQVITLDRNDNILKVRSQVEWSDGRRIILVVPRGAKAFDSEYQFRLIHRWADESDVMVALVSDALGVREMAGPAGIPVFPTVEAAQRARWKWTRNSGVLVRRSTALDEEEPKPRTPLLDRLGLVGIQLAVTVALFGIGALILLIAAVLLVPSARITISPGSETVNDEREVILDPSVTTVDMINGVLPATSFRREISGTASIATTKVATAPADYASGEVVFTNLAGTPATIPAGTIVETSSGVTVRFSTTVQAELPAGYNARVTVPVRALEAGPIGNVRALQINVIEGPLGATARVINPNPMSAGSIKQVHVVSFEDKARLREKLSQELHQAAITRLQESVGEGTLILPASVQVSILTESFDHLVDDPADTLSLHVEAVATGYAVDRADLEKFAEAILENKMPPGYSVLPGTLVVDPNPDARVEGSAVIFRMKSSFQITPQVQAGDILKGLTGKTPEDAAALIAKRIKLAEPPKIEISPSWWTRMPSFDFRLSLFVQPPTPSK